MCFCKVYGIFFVITIVNIHNTLVFYYYDSKWYIYMSCFEILFILLYLYSNFLIYPIKTHLLWFSKKVCFK